jgi:hypothetical protein
MSGYDTEIRLADKRDVRSQTKALVMAQLLQPATFVTTKSLMTAAPDHGMTKAWVEQIERQLDAAEQLADWILDRC